MPAKRATAALKSKIDAQPVTPLANAGPTAQAAPSASADLSDDEVRRRIAEAAYYRAQSRGFSPGYEDQDWFAAEADLIGRLSDAR